MPAPVMSENIVIDWALAAAKWRGMRPSWNEMVVIVSLFHVCTFFSPNLLSPVSLDTSWPTSRKCLCGRNRRPYGGDRVRSRPWTRPAFSGSYGFEHSWDHHSPQPREAVQFYAVEEQRKNWVWFLQASFRITTQSCRSYIHTIVWSCKGWFCKPNYYVLTM